jgi:hypothetical protein
MEQNMFVSFYTAVASPLVTLGCKMWANLTEQKTSRLIIR